MLEIMKRFDIVKVLWVAFLVQIGMVALGWRIDSPGIGLSLFGLSMLTGAGVVVGSLLFVFRWSGSKEIGNGAGVAKVIEVLFVGAFAALCGLAVLVLVWAIIAIP